MGYGAVSVAVAVAVAVAAAVAVAVSYISVKEAARPLAVLSGLCERTYRRERPETVRRSDGITMDLIESRPVSLGNCKEVVGKVVLTEKLRPEVDFYGA